MDAGPNVHSENMILLVDEDPRIGAVLRHFFNHFFAGEKCGMVQAATVPEALAHLEREKVDLIITDLRLAGYSGLSLLARVRTKFPALPVIVMSAYTNLMAEEDWKLLGAVAFIPKPPELSRLHEVISLSLRRSKGAIQPQSGTVGE